MVKEFPLLFPNPKEPGIDIANDGWYLLIHDSLALIHREVECMPEDLKDGITITQIKSKFGGLRIYMSNTTPYIRGVIALAEQSSYSICEQCGEKGEGRNIKNFVATLCRNHFAEESIRRHSKK